ncbi:MAG TPA: FtsX-like permease family protein, partial [Myxococcaceae bacterium]|nr:FtsX-like permease family protein [Myxococcaceae bacterium]
MARPHRHTVYRRGVIGAGVLLLAAGASLMALFIAAAGEKGFAVHPELDLVFSGFGWGAVVELLYVLVRVPAALTRHAGPLGGEGWMLLAGALSWLAGWALVASGIRRVPEEADPPSAAVGAPLHPALARYVDFYWGTLAAYGGGILAAEVALILVHTGLAGAIGVPPPLALAVALLTGFGVAFGAGFWGAANARRLSVPEATIGLVYLGLPIPVLLTLRHYVPELQIRLGYLLREITYVAELIGRPEISYWLVFAGLVLMLVFGITSGFVATGSGRADVRTGFELFIARRHVMVFRPRLLLGTLLVLLLGIIPPLLVLAIIRATEAAVERTRIKQLGLQDPLRASEALDAAKINQQSPTAMMTALSVGGVGVGVMALIIVLSVMSGFEVDLQKKILGTNAHGVVLKYGDDSFTEYAEVVEKIRGRVPDVIGMTPFILNEVMVSSEGNIAGSLIKGIDPATVGDVTDLPQNILPGGSLEYLESPEKILEQRVGSRLGAPEERPVDERGGSSGGGGSGRVGGSIDDDIVRMPSSSASGKGPVLPGIILGKELASSLKVVVGDRVNVVSPLGGELGPSGPTPKSRPFRVAGIFYSGMYEYDSKFVYIAIPEAQKFFRMNDNVVGLELKFSDVDAARALGRRVVATLGGFPYRTKDWAELNRNLFSALQMEKVVMAVILGFIVLVASFIIVATLIMQVLDKRREIAVLKSMGAGQPSVMKIFVAEGLVIGAIGT